MYGSSEQLFLDSLRYALQRTKTQEMASNQASVFFSIHLKRVQNTN